MLLISPRGLLLPLGVFFIRGRTLDSSRPMTYVYMVGSYNTSKSGPDVFKAQYAHVFTRPEKHVSVWYFTHVFYGIDGTIRSELLDLFGLTTHHTLKVLSWESPSNVW